MKTFTTILSLLALSTSTLSAPVDSEAGQSISVSYDKKYDAGGTSLKTVACSDGVNGLIHKGYSDFQSLPDFPLIGGSPTVPGWNSPNCGKCYKLHYKAGSIDKTIFVTAVDAAPGGFNLGLKAMNKLTDGMAVELGRVQATYSQADPSKCGFTS